jgi:hypothetical protein
MYRVRAEDFRPEDHSAHPRRAIWIVSMPTVPPMLSANNDYPGLSAVNAVIITSRVVHFLSTGGCFSPGGIYGRFPATAGLPHQSISDARR